MSKPQTIQIFLPDGSPTSIKEDFYEFATDYLFDSPSAASSAILGRTSNGWLMWKDKEGNTLDEIKRN